MQEAMLDAVNAIPWVALLKLSVVAVIALILKRYFDNFAAYFIDWLW